MAPTWPPKNWFLGATKSLALIFFLLERKGLKHRGIIARSGATKCDSYRKQKRTPVTLPEYRIMFCYCRSKAGFFTEVDSGQLALHLFRSITRL